MKKVGDLFAELGFRPDGSDSVKRAFVENLVKAAGETRTVVPTPTRVAERPAERAAQKAKKDRAVNEHQLSFDFSSDANDPETPFPLGTKRSAG